MLITLGGSDAENVTGKVVEALKLLPDINALIVVGGSNPHLVSLQTTIPGPSSSFRLVVDAKNMPYLMAWANVAVAAGGSTVWELAFMGLPTLVLLLADNQRGVVASMDAGQVARRTEPGRIHNDLIHFIANPELRRQMSARGRELVDGQGVEPSHHRHRQVNRQTGHEMRLTKIIVTGASGFLGTHLLGVAQSLCPTARVLPIHSPRRGGIDLTDRNGSELLARHVHPTNPSSSLLIHAAAAVDWHSIDGLLKNAMMAHNVATWAKANDIGFSVLVSTCKRLPSLEQG